MPQYKKTPSQLIKQYMENNKYFIGDDLIEFLKDVDIYFEREIKNAYTLSLHDALPIYRKSVV